MKTVEVGVLFTHKQIKEALRCELAAQGYDIPPADKCRLVYDTTTSTRTAYLSWKEEAV